MKYSQINGTELTVSQICLGTMTFGTPVGEQEAIEIVHASIDHGINVIDTANIYEGYNRFVGSEGGVAEMILGKALKGERKKITLMTKVGNPVGPKPEDKGLSKVHILREIDKSLKRLRIDTIDIYFLHRPDPQTHMEETIKTINQLISIGKIRYYGISNFSSEQIKEILSICESTGFQKPIVSQSPYSLLKRDIEKTELPLYVERGISLIPYQVLQGGLLTGKYHRGQLPPPHSRKSEKSDWIWDFNDTLFDQLEALTKLAESIQMPLHHYALAWVLARPNVVSTVVGVKNCEQLEDNIKGVDFKFQKWMNL